MNLEFASSVAEAQVAIDMLKETIQKYEDSFNLFSADNQVIIRKKIAEAKVKIARKEQYIAKQLHLESVAEHFKMTLPKTPTLIRSDGTVVIAEGRGVIALTDSLRPIVVARYNGIALVYIATVSENVILAEIYVGENMTPEAFQKITDVVTRYSIWR